MSFCSFHLFWVQGLYWVHVFRDSLGFASEGFLLVVWNGDLFLLDISGLYGTGTLVRAIELKLKLIAPTFSIKSIEVDFCPHTSSEAHCVIFAIDEGCVECSELFCLQQLIKSIRIIAVWCKNYFKEWSGCLKGLLPYYSRSHQWCHLRGGDCVLH